MEADFSGYASKADILCSDGRTIMPGAFKHQDSMKVPLVWQHGHDKPGNILGHALLQNREDGMYAYGFFNQSEQAQQARHALEHGDINMMSIWANQLIEKAGRVLHGAIREVSLVLSGANPGAVIENVTIRHDDGEEFQLSDEVIIRTGLPLEVRHSSIEESTEIPKLEEKTLESQEAQEDTMGADLQHADDETIEDVYNSMSDKQKEVLHYMLGEALATAAESDDDGEDEVKQSNLDKTDQEGSYVEHRNVFEQGGTAKEAVLSHDAILGIVADAKRGGSLKEAVEEYALSHGIENIDILFPDAKAIDNQPELFKRRTEWVNTFLGGTKKSPFSRIKTLHADLTEDEARAKGYITGNLKKEEFFAVSRRITIPTTIYKKQQLDRDDMVDITDFDVVAWLKAEMRIMLDEEIARAALLGDGRDVAHEDKINEGNIRPIATDHELYTSVVNVNLLDAQSSIQEAIDAIVLNRGKFRGTGTPTLFTTESIIARFLLLKDTLGRRIYKNLDELASELRVTGIVPVEAMEDYPELVAVIVNPADYVMGSDKGGQVSMFDDFDIDYNKHKYLIETRLSGALTKLKSAIVVKAVAGTDVLVSPTAPTFVASTGVVTIPSVTGVVYKKGSSTLSPGAQAALDSDENPIVIDAVPDSGYYFATSDDDQWTFFSELSPA